MSQEFFGLKGHGNKADFLGVLQKSVRQRSLTVPFELFRFWLHIRGDIRNRKTTPRLSESAFECLKEKLGESESQRLPDSGSRHGESGSRYSNFLKFSIDFPDFQWLNQPFNRSI